MTVEFSLVIPFYNEEKNVQTVCEEIINEFNKQKVNYEIIAVNNGSFDRTGELLDSLAQQYSKMFKIVKIAVNQGYGWGVLQGLKVASGNYVGYSVGDDQISAEDVFRVFKKAREENLDFCQGKRTIRHDTLVRRLTTKVFNFSFHLFFPCQVYDIGSNPKIMKKTWYEKISPVSKDWFIDGEIILKTYLFGGKVQEVPVTFKKRKQGKSHIKIFSALEMLKSTLIWRIKTLNLGFKRG